MSEEIKTEEAGTDNNQEEKKQKKSIVTSFMDGAKEGFYMGLKIYYRLWYWATL